MVLADIKAGTRKDIVMEVADGAITTAKIKDANVTLAKLDASVSSGFVGFFHRNVWAGSGAPTQEADHIKVACPAVNTQNSLCGFQRADATSWTYKTLDALSELVEENNSGVIFGFGSTCLGDGAIPANAVVIHRRSGAGVANFSTSAASAVTATNITIGLTKLPRKFIWANGNAKVYVNGSLLAEHTTNVPTAACYISVATYTGDPAGIGIIKLYSMLVY